MVGGSDAFRGGDGRGDVGPDEQNSWRVGARKIGRWSFEGLFAQCSCFVVFLCWHHCVFGSTKGTRKKSVYETKTYQSSCYIYASCANTHNGLIYVSSKLTTHTQVEHSVQGSQSNCILSSFNDQ